jgi:hypothetical protein
MILSSERSLQAKTKAKTSFLSLDCLENPAAVLRNNDQMISPYLGRRMTGGGEQVVQSYLNSPRDPDRDFRNPFLQATLMQCELEDGFENESPTS